MSFLCASVIRKRKATSFVTPNGQYEFLKTPFGLCSSPAVFQRFVNSVFKELIRKEIVMTYMYGIIIPAATDEEALTRLEIVLSKAKESGLQINWQKCQFMQTSVEYLGHKIERGKIKPSESKSAPVINFPEPSSIKKLQSFLGLR